MLKRAARRACDADRASRLRSHAARSRRRDRIGVPATSAAFDPSTAYPDVTPTAAKASRDSTDSLSEMVIRESPVPPEFMASPVARTPNVCAATGRS